MYLDCVKDPLSLCERCQNRSFDLKQGVVCGLTNKKPNFDSFCDDFNEDRSQTMNIERKKKIETRATRNKIIYLFCLLFLVSTPIIMLYRACAPKPQDYSQEYFGHSSYFVEHDLNGSVELNEPKSIPFEILEGNNWIDEGIVDVSIETAPNYIRLNVLVDLGDSVAYPKLYNSFGKLEDADWMRLYTSGRNSEGVACLERITTNVSQHSGRSKFSFSFAPREFKNLRLGEHDLVLDVKAVFCSFFGVDSKVSPFQFKVGFHYTADPVYATTVHFKSMVLDRKYCDSMYSIWDAGLFSGGMDAGILIKANSEKIIYKYTNESYAVYDSAKGTLYHKDPDVRFYVEALDRDGSTADDEVNSTYITAKEMRSDDYINFVLPGTKSLWLRCDSTIVVNR